MSKQVKPKAKKRRVYPFEFKLRAVRLLLEEGFTGPEIGRELGCSFHTVYKWADIYRKYGEAGLQPSLSRRKRRPAGTPAVRERALELKKDNPTWGVKRISDTLKRWFWLKSSPETVRQVLKEEGLIKPPPKKRKKNITTPRRFERATPNQMWQTDICTFRLAGKNAYLIGFIDDYSRYITGLGLYRSQTAENLLEVYRTATGEYGVPREMLTDNGRQYTNWRGVTKFEKELKKDRIKHIKSRPHHPMTLGKIERFWKSILNEFLFRAQFDSFESARERIALWVKHYNHRRPHQGIGSVCPADRFFEIQGELKKTMESGIQENVLEQALRGKPVSPFYMVGRMGGQNVVIKAEKGKVKMQVDGEEHETSHELVYDMIKDHNNEEKKKDIQPDGQVQSSTVSMDRDKEPERDMPGDVHQPNTAGQMAGDSNGRNDESPQWRPWEEEKGSYLEWQTGKTAIEKTDKAEGGENRIGEDVEKETHRTAPNGNNPTGKKRKNKRRRRSKKARSVKDHILQVGEQSNKGNGRSNKKRGKRKARSDRRGTEAHGAGR